MKPLGQVPIPPQRHAPPPREGRCQNPVNQIRRNEYFVERARLERAGLVRDGDFSPFFTEEETRQQAIAADRVVDVSCTGEWHLFRLLSEEGNRATATPCPVYVHALDDRVECQLWRKRILMDPKGDPQGLRQHMERFHWGQRKKQQQEVSEDDL